MVGWFGTKLSWSMKHIVVLVCLSLVSLRVYPQTDSTETSKVQPWRVALVGGGYAAIVTTAHLQNYNSWWKGSRGAFHFADDTTRTLGADKLGHLYFAYLGSNLVGHALVWAGLDPSSALLYSGIGSFAFQLYVEIEDGFHPELGFSMGDFTADAIGAAYPWFQNRYPVLKNIRFKWNYIRSERFKQGNFRNVIDDYESQYYWLSVNLKELFPSVVPDFWPSFFGIGLGYGVKNLDRPEGEREFYLALDYDFTKLPGEESFLAAVKHALNYIHFPAPTIRISPSVITYGLRF